MRFLCHDKRQQVLLGNLVVSLEHNAVNFVLLALLDFVHQQELARLLLKTGLDLDVEGTFFLEILTEILLTFLNQLAVDASLGIGWDQLFYLPPRHDWTSRQTYPSG